ncbi:DUF6283 family protein [Nonomuraea sp. NPDC003754]
MLVTQPRSHTASSEEDMLRLRRAQRGVMRRDDTTAADVARLTSAPRMACHKDQPDTAHPFRLCAGWLAVVGPEHIGVRMSLLHGRLPGGAVDPDRCHWPPLHASLPELLARRDAQLAASPARRDTGGGTRAAERPHTAQDNR